MNADDLITLNEEIAGMARAGLPLDQGLAALAHEMSRGRLRSVTAAIAQDLKAGHSLPEALERQRGRVPPYYASLVSAGIRTGRIGEVLATLTAYGRSMADLRTIMIDAIFYPAIILLFALALFLFECLFILPQFRQIFSSFDMKLPAATLLLLGIGANPLETIVYPLAALVFGILLARWFMRFTEQGRKRWARLLYAIPLIGTLVRSARMAAYTDLLAVFVDHGLPLPEAFRLAGGATSDPIMASATNRIEQNLAEGKPLAEALRRQGLVPEWVSWMTGLGEQRNTLGKSLHQVAETYRRQVEMRASVLRGALPPFMILVTAGTFSAFFVMGVMLPMIKLLEGLSK
jgi:type II secretory pathway component PulF